MQRIIRLAILVGSATSFAQDAPPAQAPTPPTDAEPVPAPVVVTGKVHGTITDATSKEGLPAAGLLFKSADGQHSVTTELDGTFTIDLPPGTYSVEISTPEYGEEKRTITITADQTLALDAKLAMTATTAKGETVEVFDTIDTHKSSAVLAERRAAATVSDAISSEQISRSPDSNASDAAKRMVAATIQDNRYIVIRGLGGRYSLTLLNGVPLPSPDPDVPAAPLDLFPAALITNLTVNKTASPDLPAGFAGGVLGIETRSYPTKFAFTAKVGVANNSATSFRGINGQDGSSLDILGFDSGGRALPSSIPDNKLAGDPSLTVEQRNAQLAAFTNNWQIAHGTAGPNLGLAATLGDTVKIAGERVGYFTSVSFGHGYAHRISRIARVGGDDGMGGKLPSVMQLRDESGIEQANLGAIASAGWAKHGHKLDVFGLYSHTADITASQVTGTENNASVVDRTRLQFLQRELAFAQVLGEHKLAPAAIVEWQGNVARVAQH